MTEQSAETPISSPRASRPGALWHDGEWYVSASSAAAGMRKLVLKDNDAFYLSDVRGDVPTGAAGEMGYYWRGTRHLSAFELWIGDDRPLVLDSDVDSKRPRFVVDLTNGVSWDLGARRLPVNAIFVRREILLERDSLLQRVRVHNFDQLPVDVVLVALFAADFADMFEVRGTVRRARGEALAAVSGESRLQLRYRGLDGRLRTTDVAAQPAVAEVGDGTLRFAIHLEPNETKEVAFRVDPASDGAPVGARCARDELKLVPRIRTSHDGLNRIAERAFSDLVTMLSVTPEGLYPYAGIPWYCAPFGRDGTITALQCLPWFPQVARGVLLFQARHQAVDSDDFTDREPGKIFHEMREGEMAALREIPFLPYYGSSDATPLFLILLGQYVRATGEVALLDRLWPNALAALQWMEKHGDFDGDGFIEYRSRSPLGLRNQGWKDSSDAITHEDGTLAEPPIAVCEVQGYAYRAWISAAEMAEIRGEQERAREWRLRAADLRRRLHEAFWVEGRGFFALALDAKKRPCRVLTSNAGHLLWTGAAEDEPGRRLAQRLMQRDMWTGFGIRTLSSEAMRYSPLSYHNGSVWPHDNAIVAEGLRRYGHLAGAFEVFTGLVNAVESAPDSRVPELFCGFPRTDGARMTPYPVACAPQSWASGAMLHLIRTLLGVEVDARTSTVWFNDPVLPVWLDWLEVRDLPVPGGSMDFLTVRGRISCSVEILAKPDAIRVFVTK